MPDTPPELQRAARVAARRVEKLLLEMLTEKKLGEVAVLIGWGELEPVKRIVEKDRVVKVGRGALAAIDRAE